MTFLAFDPFSPLSVHRTLPLLGGSGLAALIESLFGSGEEGGIWLPGLNTCYTDNGTTLCTAPGDLVYRVDDLSGNGNHAIQATVARRPALRQTVGGLWYLEFDGVEDYMYVNENFADNSTAKMTLVAACGQTLGANRVIISTRAANVKGWSLRRDTATLLNYFHVTHIPNVTKATPDGVCLTEVIRNGLQVQIGVDGQFDSAVTISGYAGATAGTTIGAENQGGNNYLNGGLFGIALVESVLSEVNLQNIEVFLAARSGVTLS